MCHELSVSHTHTEVSKSREKEKLQLVHSSFHPANQFKCCHNKGNSEFKCRFWWLMVKVICRLTFLNWANELTHLINYKESNKHHSTHRAPQLQFKFFSFSVFYWIRLSLNLTQIYYKKSIKKFYIGSLLQEVSV